MMMTTKRMSAHAPASRSSGSAGTRERAVVIALSPCRSENDLSSRRRKPRNSVDALRRSGHSPWQMPRTPNASKKVIFAFVARIHLR
jgi:hypothetical protein